MGVIESLHHRIGIGAHQSASAQFDTPKITNNNGHKIRKVSTALINACLAC